MADQHDKYDNEHFKDAEAMSVNQCQDRPIMADPNRHQQEIYEKHRCKDAQALAEVLESDWREGWQHADEVIRAIVTRDDLNVVDLGAGTGYFTRRLAKALPKGNVHAIDAEQTMIDWINEKIIPEHDLNNVTTKLVTFEDPMLGEVPFKTDVLVMGYAYHHIGPLGVRVQYMRDKIRPKLPSNALVIIVDFETEPENVPEGLKDIKHAHEDHPEFLSPEELKKEMESAGFFFVTDFGYDHKPSYVLAFKAKSEID